MLRRSITKILASFAIAVIGLLSFSSIANAANKDFPSSASIIYDKGLLTNEEADNIKKQTMKNGEKVISVYVTEKSLNPDIESESMNIFESWNIPEDQMLLYYETSSDRYNWVVGSDVKHFGVKEMQYSMSKAKDYLKSGDLGSGLAVAVSLSKMQMDQPGVFDTSGIKSDSKSSNISEKKSSMGVFKLISFIPVILVLAIVFTVISAIVSGKGKISEALAKASGSAKATIEKNTEKSREYVSSAEDNYNDRKAAVAKILEEEKAKAESAAAADFGFLESKDNSNILDSELPPYEKSSTENIFSDKSEKDSNKKDDPFGSWGKDSDSIFGIRKDDDPFKF